MITPLILSNTDATEATTSLRNLFNDPVTVLLVIGNTATAQSALQKISSSINSGDHFYQGVRVVQAPNPDLIKDLLSSLKINPRLSAIKWNDLNSYLLFSISNVFHNIGEAVLVTKYGNRPKYYIEKLVMMALAFDKDLTL